MLMWVQISQLHERYITANERTHNFRAKDTPPHSTFEISVIFTTVVGKEGDREDEASVLSEWVINGSKELFMYKEKFYYQQRL